MFYLVHETFVGPVDPADVHGQYDDLITVRTQPARTNFAPRAECVTGWCGTTCDWHKRAHGAYPTLDAAQSAIAELFGDVYACDCADETSDEHVVAVYRRERAA